MAEGKGGLAEHSFNFLTPFGEIAATAFGTRGEDDKFVLCVQGKSAKTDVVTEWTYCARGMAAAGWYVVLPNLHSNEKTTPGTQGAADVARI
eukprot:2962988-Prymnesium_polylepis.1